MKNPFDQFDEQNPFDQFDEAVEPDFPGASFIEPFNAVAEGFARSAVGGVAGIVQALNPYADEGAGAKISDAIIATTPQPKTAAGKQGMETLSQLVEKGIDIVNYPLSGVGGIIEMVSGQGIDQAVETIKAIQSQGVSETFGDRVMEETNSPLAATAAYTAPAAAGMLLGNKALKGAPKVVKPVADTVKNAKVPPTVKSVFQYQSPTKQRIARLISKGSTDAETAKFKLTKPKPVNPLLSDPTPKTKLQSFLDSGGPKVKVDKLAVNTIKQGFDEGVIAVVKGASKADKVNMVKMVNIMERGKKNKLFAAKNRPSDVAGDALMNRFRSVKATNKKAGHELDRVASSLKGQSIDVSPAVRGFTDKLKAMGVTVSDDFTLVFKGSDIEGGSLEALKAQNILKTTMNRMVNTAAPDAFHAHRLKKFIDSQVTFGKTASGMPGGSERVLKALRRDIDGILDSKFPEYNRVNTAYSDTIGVIDALQDVAGKKMSLTGGNANKATGTLLRRVMSNAQSRIRLLDAIEDIESVAKKYGGKFDDDLLTQVLFVDELDAVFGPTARTSFQGQIDQALKQGVKGATTKEGAIDLALKAGGKLADKARNINEDAAFKSIKELLNQ